MHILALEFGQIDTLCGNPVCKVVAQSQWKPLLVQVPLRVTDAQDRLVF